MDDRQKILNACKESIITLGKVISPQSFYLDTPPFHYEIEEMLLNKKNKQTLIEAPRGTAKSTLTIFAVLHHILFDEGNKLVIIQSKTRPEAINRLTKIKNILEYSGVFRELFGYVGEQKSIIWREDKIKLQLNGCVVVIKALGTGQQVRGALEEDTRITLYLLDDPDDEDNTKTPLAMDDNFSKFLGGVAGLDVRNGRVQVIGTPIEHGCIVARLRDAEGWVTKHFESYNEDTLIPLWPEMYSYEDLKRKKAEFDSLGMLWKFYSEYQCQLRGKDDQIFKQDNMVYWDGWIDTKTNGEHILYVKEKGEELFPEGNELKIPVQTFIGVDPANSDSIRSDYSVILTVAVAKNWDIFVLPFFRKRVLISELLDAIIRENDKFLPRKVTIETGASQDSVRQLLYRLEDKYLPGLSMKNTPKGSKDKRYLDVLEDYHRRRKIYLQRGQCDRLREEMLLFPTKGNGVDDTIDALYWAVKRAYTPDHVIETKPKSRFEEQIETTGWAA